jgi:hypothetical protein
VGCSFGCLKILRNLIKNLPNFRTVFLKFTQETLKDFAVIFRRKTWGKDPGLLVNRDKFFG